MSAVPAAHLRFLKDCLPYYETATHFFVHAGYRPDLPLDRQDGYTLRWHSLLDGVPAAHMSGKVAVVGHTPQADVLDLGHLVCIDAGCGLGGVLTAVEVTTGQGGRTMNP
jgi:serine/threonine protein phosphatase 1